MCVYEDVGRTGRGVGREEGCWSWAVPLHLAVCFVVLTPICVLVWFGLSGFFARGCFGHGLGKG